MRTIPLVFGTVGDGEEGHGTCVFSDTPVAKNTGVYFLNTYTFIYVTLNEAVHVTIH